VSISILSYLPLELDEDSIHPQEIKLFKYIYHQIRKMKTLEADKHNQPMFSVATKKLTDKLDELFEKNATKLKE
jgi:hypothetical protein